jgi:uncharacterized protein YneF (UPF0154 family)
MDESSGPKISGGYFIIARKMFDGELMNKPPLHMKLWAWMLNSAFWKDGEKLSRGQLLTSVPEMKAAMSYKIGFRVKTPTTDEIRSAYEAFMKAGMITAMKAGCGVRITICKYSHYQDFKNYEARDEARDENPMKPEVTPNQREGRLKGKNKKPKTAFSDTELFQKYFDWFWNLYALKGGRGKGGNKIVSRESLTRSLGNETDVLLFCMAVQEYLRQVDETGTEKMYLKNTETLVNQWRGYIPEDSEERLRTHQGDNVNAAIE